jgi:hypothetical protein
VSAHLLVKENFRKYFTVPFFDILATANISICGEIRSFTSSDAAANFFHSSVADGRRGSQGIGERQVWWAGFSRGAHSQ